MKIILPKTLLPGLKELTGGEERMVNYFAFLPFFKKRIGMLVLLIDGIELN